MPEITFDEAREQFRALPDFASAKAYLVLALNYEERGLITEHAVLKANREITTWITEKGCTP